MRKNIGLAAVTLVLLGVAAVPALAQEPGIEGLRKEVAALQAEVARLGAEGAAAPRLAEIERRIDLLAAEIEKGRTGGAEGEAASPVPGLGPAAAKVYSAPRGVSIGGYGEAVLQRFAGEREDGQPSGRVPVLDFVRDVVYVGYKFSDKILFNSEIEVEHATTGEGAEERGEVSLELGYLDFKPWRDVGLRAGMVLVPVGFVNELHEAPIYHGARRPEVERLILPTTWSENGAGVFGETGPVQWRAYVVAGLDARGFAGEGLREGRQSGSNSLAADVALTGRLDFIGLPGLLAGGSVFTGNSGQGASVGGRRLRGRTTLFDLHAQVERRGLQVRGLIARTAVGEVPLVNALNGLSGAESVGESQQGWYVQVAYDAMTLHPHEQWSVTPFVRYERLDTQRRVPPGFARDPANRRTVLTAGVDVKPLTNVVVKLDVQRIRTDARTGTSQVDLGLGYLF